MEDAMLKKIANILSTMTILTCMFLKVPQIFYIREKQSAEGIFIQAMLMEVFGLVRLGADYNMVGKGWADYDRHIFTLYRLILSIGLLFSTPSTSILRYTISAGSSVFVATCRFSIMTLYNMTNNYSIMTYLEYPIILVQVYIMFYYVLKFKNLMCHSMVPISAILYVCTVVGFITGAIPKTILSYLVPLCTPLSGFAKVTYIYGIVKLKNADAISLTTWFISVATNLARIFTIYVDSGDKKLMINFFISTILSSAVLGTALYYKRIGNRITHRSRKQPGARRHSHSD